MDKDFLSFLCDFIHTHEKLKIKKKKKKKSEIFLIMRVLKPL